MASLLNVGRTTANAIGEVLYGGKPRTYLGMSSLGEECSAKLWLGFHWCSVKKHSSRAERTFNVGHAFEAIIIQQLKDAGLEVYRVTPDGNEVEMFGTPDEKQEEFIGFAGHAKGHSDGRVRGVIEAPKTDHLLECKTAKEESFNEFVKKGCKKANPKYYAQAQRYMRKTSLTRCLFIVLNKNTSELYIERIDADASFQNDLERKEQHIIIAHEIPTRAYPDGFYKCGEKWCHHREVCRGLVNPLKTCRSCEFADIENDGKWTCQKQKGKSLTPQEQWDACPKYKLGWEFKDAGKEQEKHDVIFEEIGDDDDE